MDTHPLGFTADAGRSLTIGNLGAAQGVEVRDGRIYAYGDADTGVIVELRLVDADPDRLVPTGRVLRLTRDGEDLLPHPTGLTHHPALGTWIGDTVNQNGTIYKIDWERAWRDGNLDHAVLHVVEDDAAVNGTRPEFVEYDGRWVIATSDYGDVGNEVRLYDPEALLRAERTSEPGVEIAAFPCGAFVQTLFWADAWNAVVLVQNQIAGRRWRLTPVTAWSERAFAEAVSFDGITRPGELEGFHVLKLRGADAAAAVFVTAHGEDNVWLGSAEMTPNAE